MLLEDVGMIAADTSRSRVYLQALIRHSLSPGFVLVLEHSGKTMLPGQSMSIDPHDAAESAERFDDGNCWSEAGFNPGIPLRTLLESARIPYGIAPTHDINDPGVIAMVANRPETVQIYSGYGGVLLRKDILSIGKRFLHVHGGYLPAFKGSTANYYSLIVNNTMGASAIFLTAEIDGGSVLLRQEFPPPAARKDIDHVFDPAARAKVLVDVLARYAESGDWGQPFENGQGGETYHVIHPVLKHIAILAKN